MADNPDDYSCPMCGEPINTEAKRCDHCGAEFEEAYECPSCGETVGAGEEYCPKCNYRFVKEEIAGTEAPLSQPRQPQPSVDSVQAARAPQEAAPAPKVQKSAATHIDADVLSAVQKAFRSKDFDGANDAIKKAGHADDPKFMPIIKAISNKKESGKRKSLDAQTQALRKELSAAEDGAKALAAGTLGDLGASSFRGTLEAANASIDKYKESLAEFQEFLKEKVGKFGGVYSGEISINAKEMHTNDDILAGLSDAHKSMASLAKNDDLASKSHRRSVEALVSKLSLVLAQLGEHDANGEGAKAALEHDGTFKLVAEMFKLGDSVDDTDEELEAGLRDIRAGLQKVNEGIQVTEQVMKDEERIKEKLAYEISAPSARAGGGAGQLAEMRRADLSAGFEDWKEPTEEERRKIEEERRNLIERVDAVIRSKDTKKSVWDYDLIHKIKEVKVSNIARNIAASADNNIYFIDGKGALINYFDAGSAVNSIGISGSGQYVIAGAEGSEVFVLDDKVNVVWKRKTRDRVESAGIATSGTSIISSNKNVYCFDKAGEVLWGFKRGDDIRCVAISGSGEYAAAGVENEVYLFDKSGKVLWQYKVGDMVVKRSSVVTHVALSTLGDYVLVASSDKFVRLLNKDMLLIWEHESGETIDDVSLSGSGDYAAFVTGGKVIFYNNVGKVLWRYEIQGALSASVSGDGASTIIGEAKSIRCFDNINRCSNLTALAEDGLSAAKKTGVYTARGEKLLEEARNFIIKKRYGDAYIIGYEALFDIEDAKSQSTKAQNAIDDAKKRMDVLGDTVDAADAKEKLAEAEKNFTLKKYITARKAAEEAKTLAEQVRRTSRPKLAVAFELADKYQAYGIYPLSIDVSNSGDADAEDITITAPEGVVLQQELRLSALKMGEKKRFETTMRFDAEYSKEQFGIEVRYRSRFNGEMFKAYEERPCKIVKVEDAGKKQKPSSISVKTATEQKKNKLFYTVEITNNLDVPISDVSVKPYIPSDIFSRNADIPLSTTQEEIEISGIKPKKTKAATFKFIVLGRFKDVMLAGEISYNVGASGSKQYEEFEIPAVRLSSEA